MTPERLDQLLDRFSTLRIAVLGDYFLDSYLDVDPALAEPSVETGKVAHQVIGVKHSAGAAGTVVNNLAALGVGRIHAIGAIGDDGTGWELRRALQRVGCDTDALLESDERMTPVYLKPRDVGVPGLAGEHSRYDTRNRRRTSDSLVRRVIEGAERLWPKIDALILLDQVEEPEYEIVTAEVRRWACERAAANPSRIVWADSRFHIDRFHGLRIKPNQFEVTGERPTGPDSRVSTERIAEMLPRLRERQGVPVTVTLGERGLMISDPHPRLLPAYPADGPIDTTGAGDSVTAAMVAALCAGASHCEAGRLGNLAASITVRQLGTTGTARPKQLRQRLDEWRRERPQDFDD